MSTNIGVEQIQPGIFITPNNTPVLYTKNFLSNHSTSGQIKINSEDDDNETQFRNWNPFRSKLAASIMVGLNDIHIRPGFKVLYLGAAVGCTVTHVSDIVGQNGLVYAVEFSPMLGRNLLKTIQKRKNVIPIIEDARNPLNYRMMVSLVDCIFADLTQPDQAYIVGINAQHYLKRDGHFIVCIKPDNIDKRLKSEDVILNEIKQLRKFHLCVNRKLSLTPYMENQTVISGTVM